MTRLITTTELKTDGFVNANMENEYLYSAIDEAQDVFLREILGDSLYDALQGMVEEETLTGDYQTLMDEYIKYFLKYKILSLLCMSVTFKIRNAGVVSQYSNEINTTSVTDTKYIESFYAQKSDFYANRLTKYLIKNCNSFPEYKCSCDNITSPVQVHPVCSIYLG